jgi:hypothetical protein
MESIDINVKSDNETIKYIDIMLSNKKIKVETPITPPITGPITGIHE